jgi:VanZ family protein
MAGIFYVSSLQQPSVPGDLPDVNLHAAAYCGLMLLVVRALTRARLQAVTIGVLAVAWLITVTYGATDEWHQLYVPTRNAELRDWFADAIGAFAAAVALKAWVIIKRL